MRSRIRVGWPMTAWVGVLLLMAGPADSVRAQQTPGQEARDTVADTTLTTRERALQRLRALPLSPIPDTLTVDTLAADTLAPAADTVPRDQGRQIVRGDVPPADTVRVDTIPGDPVPRDPLPGEPLPGDPAPGDTLRRVLPGDLLARDTAGVPGTPRIDTLPPMPEGVLRADSVLGVLRGLEGYAQTEYRGEAAVFEAETNRLRMTGEGRVGRAGSALSTDSLLVYSGDTGVVCGYGNPVLEGEREPVESDRVCYDINRDLGMAVGARTRFEQSGTWYVRGPQNRVYLLAGGEQNRLYGERTDFTSCDLPEPHYTFQARTLKMVENDVMVARDVTLRFEDVPVFWLPWLVQSMKDGRRSGLLMPEFGVNDIVRTGSGTNRSISNLGFYWAVNDYVSLRSTFGWLSNNFTSVDGALSYRWLRQFLNGGVNLRHYWRENGSTALTINTNNSWQPDERTQLRVSGNYASSTDFVRRNSFNPRELNRQIVMNASGSRSFDWGRVTAGARRTQHLSDEKVEMMLPEVSLNLSPLTIYTSPSGANSLTWNGSADVTRRTTDVLDTLPTGRDAASVDAGLNHRLGFGRFNVSQRVSWSDDLDRFKPALNPERCFLTARGERCVAVDEEGEPVEPDTALPEVRRQELTWSTSTGYQQDLWTGTTLSPSISISGSNVRDPRTRGEFVTEPFRVSLNTNLNTTIYGFWPGVGPFSRIRHKISPRLGWSWSPTPGDVTPLQDSVFGLANLRDRNRLTLSFNQTFEAKYEESDTATAEDTAGEGGEGGLQTGGPTVGDEPRRLPQARKITLLAINTSTPFTYDFVAREEEGRGFLTDQVNNAIRSDLLSGLQVNMTHDLFRELEPEEGEVELEPREFAPFLSRLTASFSIDEEFWLFRALGLTGGGGEGPQEPRVEEEVVEGTGGATDPAVGAESDPGRANDVGRIVPGGGGMVGRGGAGGGWHAALNYTLDRRRPESGLQGNQMVSGNVSFSPTEHWGVNWSTAYSFTDREFANHVLTLTRDLHRWQANFNFIRAQNGNFMFSFRVNLIDNPDLKLEYDQHTDLSPSGLQPET